jgi:hypothetical protein
MSYVIEVPEEWRRGYVWKPTESRWESRDMALYYALTVLKGRGGHDWRIVAVEREAEADDYVKPCPTCQVTNGHSMFCTADTSSAGAP